jgi:hypothetical protein
MYSEGMLQKILHFDMTRYLNLPDVVICSAVYKSEILSYRFCAMSTVKKVAAFGDIMQSFLNLFIHICRVMLDKDLVGGQKARW